MHKLKKNTLWVAFSGGSDSHVLLHFLSVYFLNKHIDNFYHLKAIHINHQLLTEALEWEMHCRKICRHLHIPLKIVRVNILRKPGESLEAKAREARYAVFKQILKKNDILLTAHHQNDQAETLLLQLLRGAGLRGASAMRHISQLSKGFLLRPFLSFSREDLKNYAIYHQLQWIDDPSNQEEKFDRNFLRLTVFPLLKKRWPQMHKTFARFAKHCAEQEKLLNTLAEKDYQACQSKYFNALSISQLKLLELPRQKNLLRYFIKKLGFNSLSEKILEEILKICHMRKDKNPVIKLAQLDIECRRFKENLFIFSSLNYRSPELSPAEIIWCQNNLTIDISHTSIHIAYRKGGEKFKPHHSKHTRTLKNLFQEWKIPPWLRDRIPLIYCHQQLIAVVGYAFYTHPLAGARGSDLKNNATPSRERKRAETDIYTAEMRSTR